MAVVGRNGEQYQEDELVVAQSHRRLVQHGLARLHVTTSRVETSEELDLVMLRFDKAEVRAAAVPFRDPGWAAVHGVRPDEAAEMARWSDLALVVWELRRRFAELYSRWVPSMDTNRLLDLIHAFPYRKGAVPTYPDVAPEQEWAPVAAPRGGGEPVRVGILDTGIFPHRQLADRLVARPDSILDPREAEHEAGAGMHKAAGHATFVAGLIAKQAPDAVLVARRVLDDAGRAVSSWEVAKRMAEFLTEDVDVLNLSFGCSTGDGRPPLVLERAIRRLSAKMAVVACAGNTGAPGRGENIAIWPGALDDVITVGVPEPPGYPQEWFSPEVPWVDLTAPGHRVTSTYLVGDVARDEGPGTAAFAGYATWSGTSFAAAVVSGEIASRIRPGQVTAEEALDQVLKGAAADRGVRPFEFPATARDSGPPGP
ncbi:S8/S53 family peptidase [Streptosporangium sp. KLBMP 9127]|nr:S8/S53 family peptidase [Streptosporangium sp. KLBMP 9127]